MGRLLNFRSARPFPVAGRSRAGEPYRHMHPRLAAIDLLREKIAAGTAGLDPYDDTILIVDALEHERVWVHRCIELTGLSMGCTLNTDGLQRARYRAVVEPDVRLELGLDEDMGDTVRTNPMASRMHDVPLASRGVDDHVDVLASIERAHAAYDSRFPYGVEQVH
jgi:hypothetical protein